MEEIAAILPEIREKIQDTRDMEAESLKKIEDKKSEEEGLAKANGNGERGDAPNGGWPLTFLLQVFGYRRKDVLVASWVSLLFTFIPSWGAERYCFIQVRWQDRVGLNLT